MCGNEIASSAVSPSGKWKAVIFMRNCGATTGMNTQVSVLTDDEKLPDEGGNVLIVDDSVKITPRWESDSSLVISKASVTETYKQVESIFNIKVKYFEENAADASLQTDEQSPRCTLILATPPCEPSL